MSESGGRPRAQQVDLASALRRGQRGFVVRLAVTWVTTLAATAVLIGAGVATRPYLHRDQPPAGPVLAARWVAGTVRLSWTGGGVDAARFLVVRDGAVLARTAGRAFDDRDVAAGEHAYRVRAVDAAGRPAAESNLVTVSVPATATTRRVRLLWDPASGTCRGAPPPSKLPGIWQYSAPPEPVHAGDTVEIAMRSKYGISPLQVRAMVVAPGGGVATASATLQGSSFLRLRYPGEFRGAGVVEPGVYTVVWETASGRFILCYGFVAAA